MVSKLDLKIFFLIVTYLVRLDLLLLLLLFMNKTLGFSKYELRLYKKNELFI